MTLRSKYIILSLVSLITLGCSQTKQIKSVEAEVDEENISPYVVNDIGTIKHYCKPCETQSEKLCYLYQSQKSDTWEEISIDAVQGLQFIWGHQQKIQLEIVKEKRFAPRDTELYKVQKVISSEKVNEPFRLDLSEKNIRYRQEVATTIPEFSFLYHPTTIVFNNTTLGHQFLEKFQMGKSVPAVYKTSTAPNTIEMIEFIIE